MTLYGKITLDVSCNKVTINVTIHVECMEGSSCNKVTIKLTMNVPLYVEFGTAYAAIKLQ